MAMLKLADLERLVNEVVKEDSGKLFTSIRSENEKESNNVKKDAEERIKDSTPTKGSTQIVGYRGEQPPSGRNAMNLNYDHIDKKYQERAKALVQGKASPNQADIDDEASGISTKGNKAFYDKMQNDNKGYANIMGYTQINDRLAHPPKGKAQFATESKAKIGKVKIGDVFTESKNGLLLQVTGINEDKTRVSFIDESGKKYSLAIDKFKNAVREDRMVRGNTEMLNEVAPLAMGAAKVGGKIVKGAVKTGAKIAKGAVNAGVNAVKAAGDAVGNAVGDNQDAQQQGTDPQQQQESKTVTKESKIKRLKFNKTVFINELHAKELIPEQYKVPGNVFAMIDKEGNEYLMKSDKNQNAIVLEYKNQEKAKKEIERMKQLWEYNPGKARGGSVLNEARVQRDIQQKARILTEKKK